MVQWPIGNGDEVTLEDVQLCVRLREAARRKERTPRTRQTTSRREPSEQKGQP